MKLLGVPGRQDLYGGGDYGLDLRGFGGTADSNQAVIVDGVRINEADLGGTRLAGIPIDSVQRIEVIRGSGAVLYGEGASAGVIVITTKAGQGVKRSNAAQVYAGLGSHALRELRVGATLVADELSFDLAANRKKADNHRDNFRTDIGGASLTGQWQSGGLRIGASLAYDSLDGGLPGGLSAQQYQADPRQASKPNDSVTIWNHRQTVFAQADLGAWQLGLDAGWRQKRLDNPYVSSFGPSVYRYDVDARDMDLHARHAGNLADLPNVLVLGLNHAEWTRNGQFSAVATQHSQAAYVRDELTLSTATRLSAGWRAEQIRKDNTDATSGLDQARHAWELGIVQPLDATWAVYGRAGGSFRLPNVDEFGFTPPNTSLRVQRSQDRELGLRWSAGPSRAELRVYRSSLTDEIGYDPQAANSFGGQGANVNFEPTRRQGVETEVSHRYNSTLNVRAVAAWRQASFVAGIYDGKRVPLTPRQTLSLRADWMPAAQHRINAGVILVSSQVPDFANSCRMPGYATTDLRYAYQFGAAELAAGVANLGDHKYYTQAYVCSGGVTGGIYPEAGRTLNAAVRYSF